MKSTNTDEQRYRALLNLQLFGDADDSESPSARDSNDTPSAHDEDKHNSDSAANPRRVKKYSDDDVDKLLNRKFAEWEVRKQKAIDEAKKLETMTAEEKHAAELQEMQSKLAALEERERTAKMADAARGIFAEKGVAAPDSIVSLLVADDAESTKFAVETYIDAFQEAVNVAVKKALAGSEPLRDAKNNHSSLTKNQILSIPNRAERQRLIKENPKLFGL